MFIDSTGGKNAYPKSKVDSFAAQIKELNNELVPDVAFMKFCFVDRTEFRSLKNEKETPIPIDGGYILPEGGTNNLAIMGCTEIVDEINVETV